MAAPAALRALAHRDFRRLFLAQLVAQVGGWMQTVAQAWLVLQLTGSPLKLGLLGTLQFGPILLLSIVSGAVADRLPRRGLLVGTQLAMAGQALALAGLVATGHVAYWQVAGLALVTGLATTLDLPARQALVMALVGQRDLVNAVALNSAAFNAARIAGPAVAGVLIARWGVAPAFLLNGLGFLVVVATLLRLDEPPRPPRRPATLRQEIAEGLRYAARAPGVRFTLGILAVVSLCVFNFTVYVPLLARDVLHLGPEGFGLLMAALGVGAVSGALVLGARGARPPGVPLLLGLAAAACAGLVGLGLARHAGTAAPLLAVTGFVGIVVVASCNTALQLGAPDELRGRVMSLYTLVSGGLYPVGAFLIGATAERWGVSTSFLLAGGGGLAALALLARLRPR
jgi:MFS family permease